MSKPQYLSAKYRDSFAYPTLKDRVPTIICKVIDLLHRQRKHLEPDHDQNYLKACIEKMAQLRYELQTNKPLTAINDGREDEKVWNDYLDRTTVEEGEPPKWFNTRWLYSECYAYRRLLQCMAASPQLADLDIFKSQKEDAFFGSLSAIRVLAQRLHDVLIDVSVDQDTIRHKFLAMLEVSLWGNKCDLSISAGSAQNFSNDPLEQILLLRKQLLIDDSEAVWDYLSEQKAANKIVDLVMDNAGFELFADLCLADFLVTFGLATKVRLRVKRFPWFVSDTTPDDIDWVLSKLTDGAQNPVSGDGKCDIMRSDANDRCIDWLGRRWRDLIDSKVWTVHSDPFWTYPHDFRFNKFP